MRYLQQIQDKHSKAGLTVLGADFADAKDIALEELRRQNVSFPNVIDASPAGRKAMDAYRVSGIPLNYIIDKDGKIVDGWCGNEPTFERAMKAIKKAGIADAKPLQTQSAQGGSVPTAPATSRPN